MVFTWSLSLEGQGSNPRLEINHFPFNIDSEILFLTVTLWSNNWQHGDWKVTIFLGSIFVQCIQNCNVLPLGINRFSDSLMGYKQNVDFHTNFFP